MKDKDIVEVFLQITNVLFKDDIVPAILIKKHFLME
jgi:hypothetical protein